MVENVVEPKSIFVSIMDNGWAIGSLFFLCCGAIGIIYGDQIASQRLTTVGIVALILATLCEVKDVGRRIP